MDEHVAAVDHMDIVPSLASEGVMDPPMLPEDHHLHDHVTPEEVLDALNQASKQVEAANSLTNGTVETPALDVEYQNIPNTGTLTSEVMSTSVLDADHIRSAIATSNDQDYIAFEDPVGVDIHAGANHFPGPMLGEHSISRGSKGLAHEIEAGTSTNPSVGRSIAYPEPEAGQTPETHITEVEHPAAEPLRRMDDETMSFQQPSKAPGDDVPTDAPLESSRPKPIYLEHIQVIEPDEPTEGDDPIVNPEDLVQVIGAIGDSVTAEGNQPTLETEGLLVPAPMEVEPTSAVSTEFAIENDPALALTETATTTTTEEASVPMDLAAAPNQEPQLEPSAETVVTATTTVATVIETETEADPNLGADADADGDDDQAEYMRREEQIQLEQSNMDIVGQDAQDKSPDQAETLLPAATEVTPPEPAGESVSNDHEPMPAEELGQAQEETAGSTNSAALADQALNPPSGDSSPHAPQYATTLDAPPVVAPPGLFGRSKSPEWQGFAALDADAPGSPEFADHSSEIIEEPQNDPETNDASPEPTPLAGTSVGAGQSRKPKMIMEVVIPIPSKGKKKAIKSESPEPTTRGRLRSRAVGSSESNSSSKAKPRSRSSGSSVSSSRKSTRSISPASTPKRSSARKRTSKPRPRLFGRRKRVKKAGKPAPAEHEVHSMKVEVVMQKRPGLLRRTGSIPSGNNVKFAPTAGTSKKRKAESEPDEEEQSHEAHSSDADAEGEIEEGYEDVEEEEPEPEPEPAPKPEPSKPGPSKPIKRPRRSISARKTPAKVPEVLTDNRRPKKRRVHR
ncbi:hypothetical protein FRC10_009898 [Ceratobasidium sp. 414]|nr:hypothetical protein FRC10_009898 [Ceratobasidium sp. 414]